MASIIAVVDDVTAKQTEKGAVYTVVAGGDKFSTFKLEVAEQAKAAKGQRAVIDYITKDRERDGKTYTNKYVNSVVVDKPAASGFTVEVDPKQESIARAVALKAAVDFQAGKGSVLDVKLAADEFLAWLNGVEAKPREVVSSGLLDEAEDLPF